MPYAILIDGAPVEIPTFAAWTSTQYKVESDEDAQAYGVEIGAIVDRKIGHAANTLDAWGAPERERYGVLSFDVPTPPDGQALVSYTLALTDGAVVATGVFAAPAVPEQVTRTQGRCQLIAEGLLADIDAFVGALDSAVEQNALAKEYWASTDVFRRDNVLLNTMWAVFGRTGEQLDATFRGAATFPI